MIIRSRILISCALLYLAACLVAGIFLAEFSLRLHRLPVGDSASYRSHIATEFHVRVQDASVAAGDGAKLSAWFIQPTHPNGESVIILHGITANRVGSSGYADPFLARGYSVLLPDSRAHGASGGAIATFGILERDDVRRWVAWLRGRASGCTYLLGESMGAAIGLQSSAVTPALCAVAVEDPYSTFRAISYERLGRGTHTGTLFWQTLGRPIIESAILYTRLRYGIWLSDADPQSAVRASNVPTLLITGTADANIPMHHAQQLAANCSNHCELWVIRGAAHGGASTVAHDEFFRRILDFFAAHDQP